VVEEYVGAIMRCCDGDEWLSKNKPEITIYQAGGAFEIDQASQIVKSFQNSFNRVLGKDVVIAGSPAGCDARIWHNIAKCPTIQFGPGRLSECHSVNEHVEISQYLDAILIYADMILNWKDSNK